MLKMTGLSKVYRTELVETYALRDFNIEVERRRVRRRHRPVGLGQDDLPDDRRTARGASPAAATRSTASRRSRLDDDARSRIRNEKIGFIFQAFNLIPDLNVADNVEVPLRYRGMRGGERRRAGADALERVGLSARASATTRRSSRAASSSASRSRARSPAARACCSPTSRPATSTRRWRAA